MLFRSILWGVASGHGVWYPVNLLAGTVVPNLGDLPAEELSRFHADWFAVALTMHASLTMAFGIAFALLAPRLKPIPASIAWGGLMFPLLWTGMSYALMGVVNPTFRQLVNWPWFIVSQFVFGMAAAVVVERSEKVYIAPAGRGPDRVSDFIAGQEGQS